MSMIGRILAFAVTLFCPVAGSLANEARPYVKVEVPYATQSKLQRFDLYTPSVGRGPFPVVVWIHGGNFYGGDKSAMPHVDRGPIPTKPNEEPYQIQVPDVAALTRMGYAVVSLNYRLGGPSWAAAMLNAISDGKAAVRYLHANADALHIDPTRIAVWGNSAGGFIAEALGLTGDQPSPFDNAASANVSSDVRAVIVCFGAENTLSRSIMQMEPYIGTAMTVPPFLIVNGDRDNIVTAADARRLHDALISHGWSSTLTIVKGAGHEDPSFMKTQMQPAFDFLLRALGT
ncbi:prolyl oligopeptidase family serine peptidase [Mesorhizobium sp. RCC_202]|uniref:prolyl oligopeptidase family serine peptidase n=1 Tax=Mesorhizobium sp. RCC_202 TaxID=3239222 RepID=UPI003525141A